MFFFLFVLLTLNIHPWKHFYPFIFNSCFTLTHSTHFNTTPSQVHLSKKINCTKLAQFAVELSCVVLGCKLQNNLQQSESRSVFVSEVNKTKQIERR